MIHQLKIQKLLQKTKNEFVSVSRAAHILKTDEKKAGEILIHLENTGYLEKSFDELWQHSLRGKVLANKKLDRTFRVETLSRQLSNLMKRVQIVNSSPEYPHCIICILVTSEYPVTQSSNGMYIAYSICPKGFTEAEREIAERALRRRHHRNFDNIVESIFYPEEAVRLFLKAGSPVLKLKQYSADEIKVIDGYKVFEFPVKAEKVRKQKKQP